MYLNTRGYNLLIANMDIGSKIKYYLSEMEIILYAYKISKIFSDKITIFMVRKYTSFIFYLILVDKR